MTDHPPPAPYPPTLELRVLEGELRGARSPMQAEGPVSVGTALGNDIVLRGADLGETALLLDCHTQGLKVRVLCGQVVAQGQTLTPGSVAIVPWYAPVHLGSTVIAVGEPNATAWDAVADAPAPTPAPAGQPPHSTPARRPWPRWLLVAGGGLSALSMSVLAWAYTASPPPASAQQQAGLVETALRQAGFDQLGVQPGEGGVPTVSGYLDTSAQRARLEQALARHGLSAQLRVWVNGNVVSSVLDVFRVNGVAAEASPAGPGAVLVSTREADAARLTQVQATARRDIAGLVSLEVRNTPPPAAPEPVPVVDDPGKRVASIVPGDSPYIVTADGTRYFEGALLPTGHRIAAIHEREVLLERGGITTPLRF